MRITAELINNAPQFFNPLKERELDLRGNRIAVIENLGVTENGFDTIDLSENEIKKVDNFPHLPRLKTLMLSRNKINELGSLSNSLPNLQSLVLIDNDLTNLDSIDVLGELFQLTRLSLLKNALMNEKNARLYIIHKIPQLRVLNFQRVKLKERNEAKALYGESKRPTKRSREEQTSATSNGSVKQSAKRARLTEDEQAKIATAIANAKSMEEVQRLEAALRDGQLPSDLQ
mmetsp:Transcript_8081/g.13951  ORF Transcript_8081/g.13951 Transcript_8081/m.13951 type:complete len:231 (-) Transcript_8081:28-720(-)